jgi:hypothetical protein
MSTSLISLTKVPCDQTYLYGTETYVDCPALASTTLQWKDDAGFAEMNMCSVHAREFKEEATASTSDVKWVAEQSLSDTLASLV